MPQRSDPSVVLIRTSQHVMATNATISKRDKTNFHRTERTNISLDVIIWMKFSPLHPQRTGLSGAPTLVALTSEESHYSIVKVTRTKSRFLCSLQIVQTF